MTQWTKRGDCNGCGFCCVALTRADLSYPMGPRLDREYYRIRGFSFVKAANGQELAMLPRAPVMVPCPMHDPVALRCRIYETRPVTCQAFPQRGEDILGSPCSYWFETPLPGGKVEIMGGDGSPFPGHKVLEVADVVKAGGQP